MVPLLSGAASPTGIERTGSIRVVVDHNYAPYSFRSDEAALQGILIDQWKAWEKKTGVRVEIMGLDWGEALRRMSAGEFDVIDSIVETAERREDLDFTAAYTPVEASIFFRKDISGITDLPSLRGFPVGMEAGDQHIDRLREQGVTTVIPFPNKLEIVEAARQRKINVFVIDNPSAFYLLSRGGLENEFRSSAPIFRDKLRRAVRRGDTATLKAVSSGFAAIDPDELARIEEKWFGRTINRDRHYLTYTAYAAAVMILGMAVLTGWNRMLSNRILQRTAALSSSEKRFRALSTRLQSVREEEATRIAREIHDELGAKLTGLKLDLRRSERKLEELEESPQVNALLDMLVSATELADDISATIQEIAVDLRPGVLDKLGLGAALHYESRRFGERTGIQCHVRLPEPEPAFSTELSTTLFRIFQECLTNVTRHARATRVEAELRMDHGEFVTLSIRDNGVGLPPESVASSTSLGLLGMQERAALLGGKILFEATPGGGTTVTVHIAKSAAGRGIEEPS